jgi:CheY-like chemotaxis protein
MTVLSEMAAAIWSATGSSGSTPTAAYQAARDLIELYEALNNSGIEDLVRRFPENISGDDLAWFAMTPGPPATQAIYVPDFTVTLDGDRLVWDGGSRLERNPARAAVRNAGEEVLLIEDDPMIQRSTTRMLKKLFPSAAIVIADNADAAIADLKVHEFSHVVSDVDILGDKSGIDVFRWVQQHQPHMVDRYTFFTGNVIAEQVHDRVVLKPAGFSELRDVVMRAASAPSPARVTARPAAPATTSRDIAHAVLAAMPAIVQEPGPQGGPRGRYGARKVFIAAIWRHLQGSPELRGMTESEFKRELVAANRFGGITLARADLVGAMDRQEVAQSEIEDRGATFHFVLDPSAKDAWG